MEETVYIPPQPTAYYDESAEKAVLGSMLESPKLIPTVMEIIDEQSFYKTPHQLIFHAIMQVYNKHGTVDCLLVNNKLREEDLINRIGDEYTIPDLMATNPTAIQEHAEHYARIVKEKAYRRKANHIGKQIAALSNNLNIEGTDELSTNIEQLVSTLTEHHRQGARLVGDIAREIIDEIKDRKVRRMEYSTGITDLDILTAGLQMGELFIIAGKASMGKTTVAAQIATYQACTKGNPVLFCTYEMSSKSIVMRMLAQDTGISFQKLSAEVLNNQEHEELEEILSQLTGKPLYINDTPYNIQQLKAHVKYMKSKHDIIAMFVDYITIIPQDRTYKNQVEKITEYSVQLKAIATENNISVVALSQLSRASERRAGGRPRLSDLRDSGSLEQAADVVLFIDRPDFYDENDSSNLVMLHLDKQRNGPTGEFSMRFNGERFRLEAA